jgi:hypothetical protein
VALIEGLPQHWFMGLSTEKPSPPVLAPSRTMGQLTSLRWSEAVHSRRSDPATDAPATVGVLSTGVSAPSTSTPECDHLRPAVGMSRMPVFAANRIAERVPHTEKAAQFQSAAFRMDRHELVPLQTGTYRG